MVPALLLPGPEEGDTPHSGLLRWLLAFPKQPRDGDSRWLLSPSGPRVAQEGSELTLCHLVALHLEFSAEVTSGDTSGENLV
ncbi:hypothetical protein J1605_000605 [Eschrichtius robustus]|uniref:Uncharacterized protein n=1 Tax=Eschrichtius robustus TaxID=9764 RepID=A0AB34GT33_ESCRO|nr:hypothetical protein J1605_000605 [Eschrichtius robustus]